VPRNTLISVNIFDMMRSQSAWGPDAEEFIPERFLPEDHPFAEGIKVTRNDNPYAFNAFGAGSRSCIGISLCLCDETTRLYSTLISQDNTSP